MAVLIEPVILEPVDWRGKRSDSDRQKPPVPAMINQEAFLSGAPINSLVTAMYDKKDVAYICGIFFHHRLFLHGMISIGIYLLIQDYLKKENR
jgi:hypothetical protein